MLALLRSAPGSSRRGASPAGRLSDRTTDWQAMNPFSTQTRAESGFDLSRFVRRAVALAFALVQLVLVARIVLDLGVIPEDGTLGEMIITYSDLVAAPVEGISGGLGFGVDGMAGQGFNPVMLAALVGWSVVEGLVMRVVRKFDQI